MPKRLLGLVVGGADTGMSEESKEARLFRAGEIRPQGLGGFEWKRPGADFPEFSDELFF